MENTSSLQQEWEKERISWSGEWERFCKEDSSWARLPRWMGFDRCTLRELRWQNQQEERLREAAWYGEHAGPGPEREVLSRARMALMARLSMPTLFLQLFIMKLFLLQNICNTQFSIFTIFKCTVLGIQYVHPVVHPSPHPAPELFFQLKLCTH